MLKGKKTTVEYLASNQVVGSSNLSGRAKTTWSLPDSCVNRWYYVGRHQFH